jgi:exopolyphosphatase/guanosine-5'-triphosphate,3'-diphosphate pyrophosphatase
MRKKIAIIDLGTNTFHLLIAKGGQDGYAIMHRERIATKIGKGGINEGIITEEGFQRSMIALQSFKNQIDHHNVEKVYAFGTSALRNARNKVDILSRIKNLTGIEVEIISGDREAEFIYLGVRSALEIGDQVALVMDIGGGSVEFIVGNNSRILWKKSLEIGAQRLLEDYQAKDPISKNEINKLDKHFESNLSELFDALSRYKPHVLIGSSGTFDTLSDIFCKKYEIEKSINDSETPLTIAGFYNIYQQLITKDRAQRMQIPGMIEMRVDMIVVASCLIRFIMEKYPFEWIRVSTYALKEGVLAWLGKRQEV